MRKLLLLALCAILAISASADQVKVGKRTWSFDPNPDGKTCVVRGVFPANGKVSIPAKLGGLAVTRIDPFWIEDNPAITSLTIPAGVTSICDYDGDLFSDACFWGCSKLTTLKVASGNKSFSAAGGVLYDKKKTKVLAVLPSKKGSFKVPASVRTIPCGAFDGSKLTSVTLPPKLKAIEWDAFSSAYGIRRITIPASVTSIGGCAFAPQIEVLVAKKNKRYSASGGVLFDKKKTTLLHCPSTKTGVYKVPASVTKIAEEAFHGCDRITKVALGKKVRTIEGDAFSHCKALKSLSIPASVTAIGYVGTSGKVDHANPFGNSGVAKVKVAAGNRAYAARGGCLVTKDGKTLVAVPPAKKGAFSMPSSVTRIGYGAFDGCGRITSISVPASVREWDLGGLECSETLTTADGRWKGYKSALKSFKVAAGNPVFASAGGALTTKDKKTLLRYPDGKKAAYTVPSSIRHIGAGAFDFMPGPTSVTVPATVEDDGTATFYACVNVQSIRLPSKFKTIGGAAFCNCLNLSSVSLPSSLESIGQEAFANCPKLASLTVPASVKTIGDNAFQSPKADKGLKRLSLPNRSVCDIARQGLPAACKVTYRDATPVYWLRLVSNGGSLRDHIVDYDSFSGANGIWNYAIRAAAFRGRATTLPANPFTNFGSSFAGWSTSPAGGVKYKDRASVKDLAAAGRTATLYAVWRPVKTTYRFNANGGSGSMSPVTVDADEWETQLPYCSFWRDGWTFGHWNTKADDSGDWYGDESWAYWEDAERDVTVTLYAIWYEDLYDCRLANERTAVAFPLAGGVVFAAAGDVPWAEAESDGAPCLESGAIGDGGTSTLRATVEGAGTLAFRWRTSSEEDRDIAFFSVDGKDFSSRSGLDEDWVTVSFRIEGDGPHALSWTYAKDASGSAGDDRARLADVVWLPD